MLYNWWFDQEGNSLNPFGKIVLHNKKVASVTEARLVCQQPSSATSVTTVSVPKILLESYMQLIYNRK